MAGQVRIYIIDSKKRSARNQRSHGIAVCSILMNEVPITSARDKCAFRVALRIVTTAYKLFISIRVPD